MRELMNLKENDVIDDKLAGDSFDILIQTPVRRVTDRMAVRITRLRDRTPSREEEEE